LATLPELPHVAGVSHHYLETEGVRFHVAEAGRGEPLVMLHGWPQNWYMWRRLVVPLGERYRLIMPDLRGFGWSDAPPGGYNKERLASDVLALLDQLGVDRFRLMGHDWGGLISYFIALRDNPRVERLMPLNIIHPWPSQAALLRNLPRSIYAYRNAIGLGARQMRDAPGRFSKTVESDLGGTNDISDADLRIYVGSLSLPGREHVTTLVYRDFMTREVFALGFGRYRSRRLTMPTLVLFGEDDATMNRRLLHGYQAHADDMRVEFVPGCGHFIVDEKPALIAERALEFFA
jgi:pimeloyl-ACP methyl ester carboxylesterase